MRRSMIPGASALAGLVCLALAPTASAIDEVNTAKLRRGVTVNGILQHERALQAIANLNGGTRASGTPGYEASAGYVKARLEKAGYQVSEQSFEFPYFQEVQPSTLAQTAPDATDYETATFEYSGSGDVTGPLREVANNQFPPAPDPSSSSAGCDAADFAGVQAGDVVLIQRGTCSFAIKAANAEAAGAGAAVIFNEGQDGRTELLTGTLGGPDFTIPVLGVSFSTGEALHASLEGGTVTLRATAATLSQTRTTKNILADTPRGDPSQALVVGAHLDSVNEGPGINDNGSGTSTILEIAEEMSRLNIKPRRQVRFAFWGAEESGLLGSTHYVDSLGPEGIGDLYANLNFDMVGSPNYVRFVYDGDGSDTPDAGPPGSAQIENVFTSYFASQGLFSKPTAFDGRSDYGPFIAVGVPAGGLFSGAEGIKTPEEAAVYGGTAGIAYDANYHQAGDTINNLNTRALNEMGDSAADATLRIAKSRSGFFEDGSRVGRKALRGKQDFRGPDAIR